jgi:transposase
MGAACPQTGQTIGLLAPHLDTSITNVFLEQFSRELLPGVHAVLVWDQAGFHTAKALQVPTNVTILPLPPYSPELNPIENLWHYLRSHYWSNRSYEDYDTLSQTATAAWQKACLDPDLVRSVCAAPYLDNAIK